MMWLFLILLFLITIAGGLVPLFLKSIKPQFNNNLLAFSGAVLLGITFLHLLPEVFEDLGHKAGYLVLAGFFLQLFLQKFTHGLEHGHAHTHDAHKNFETLLLGIYIHAFMEGIPLGFNFRETATSPSLFFAVSAHKFPEALTLMSVIAISNISFTQKCFHLLFFALLTPLAGLLAQYYGNEYLFTSKIVSYIIPVVVGAFIHIATTIFYESGAKHHQLDLKKMTFVIFGLLISLLTLMFH